jgi:pimeloyl-ACP methyl ester carboxylesterase
MNPGQRPTARRWTELTGKKQVGSAMELATHPWHSTRPGSRGSIALVHGISGNSALFDDFARLLADEGWSVIGVDLRGHGDSDPGRPMDAATMADDLVETLPTELAAVVGHSLGGRVLLDAVARLRPRAAIYLDPAFMVPADIDLGDRSNVSEHRDGTAYTGDELEALHPLWGQANIERALASHASWDRSSYEEIMIDFAEHPPVLGAQPVPSFVLAADTGAVLPCPPEVQHLLRDAGWTVDVLEASEHNMHLVDAARVLDAIRPWLESAGDRAVAGEVRE